jgi:hypothetical protein
MTVPIVPDEWRFMDRIGVVGNAVCWKWQGFVAPNGYGQLWTGSRKNGSGKTVLAHRWSYEHFIGPIPDGMVLDHTCRMRDCVNPAHLEPVTNRENLMRGATLAARNSQKTHCYRGHEFTADNTYVRPAGDRACRICQLATKRARRQRVAA